MHLGLYEDMYVNLDFFFCPIVGGREGGRCLYKHNTIVGICLFTCCLIGYFSSKYSSRRICLQVIFSMLNYFHFPANFRKTFCRQPNTWKCNVLRWNELSIILSITEQSFVFPPGQTSDILYYEVLDIPLPELQGLKTLKVAFHHATKDEVCFPSHPPQPLPKLINLVIL